MSVVLLLLLSVLVPLASAAPPVSAVTPTKPTSAPRPASSASGAQTSGKATQSPAPRPASSTGFIGTLDPKKPPTVPCPVTEQRTLVAASGQTLTLPCRAPANASIVAVMWTRRDQKAQNVLLVQNGKAVLLDQQPWFRSRVTLKDPPLRGGDLSLVLKDARPGDAGTYDCRYKERRGTTTMTSDPVSTVTLAVPLADDGSDARRRVVTTVALSVAGVVVVFAVFVAVVVGICRRCRR